MSLSKARNPLLAPQTVAMIVARSEPAPRAEPVDQKRGQNIHPLSEYFPVSLLQPAMSADAQYSTVPNASEDADAMISKAVQNAIQLASMGAAPLPCGDSLVPSSIGIPDASCFLPRSLLLDSVTCPPVHPLTCTQRQHCIPFFYSSCMPPRACMANA